MVRDFFVQPGREILACLEPIMSVRNPLRAMGPMLIAMVVCWFVYVPIHELLHCAGCEVTGGDVSRLEVAPRYGAALLAKIFPFVVSGSDYAGQLTGFDTKGSDLIYLATDFGPFVLTVLLGVPLIRLCTHRRRPILFGIAVVLGLASFYNIPGDYFEMGSIITTRVATFVSGAGPEPIFAGIRSDDVFTLLSDMVADPAKVGLHGWKQISIGSALVLVSLVVDVFLAFATYFLGSIVANVVIRPATVRTAPAAT